MANVITMRRWAKAAFVSVVALTVIVGCSNSVPDAADLEGWGREYVRLINAGDAEGLREHLNNAANPSDAELRIKKLAGKRVEVERVDVHQEMGSLYQIDLVLAGTDPTQLSVDVAWEDSGWVAVPMPS